MKIRPFKLATILVDLEHDFFKELDLTENIITNEQCDFLFTSLEKNKTLTSLKLCNIDISDENSIKLVNFIVGNPHLKNLSLEHVRMSTQALNSVITAISTSNIRELVLSSKSLTDENVMPIKNMLQNNKTLSKLSLSGDELSDELLKTITPAINNHSLSALKITSTKITDIAVKNFFSETKNNTSLKEITFNTKDVRLSELMSDIKQNNTLTSLTLSYKKDIRHKAAEKNLNQHLLQNKQLSPETQIIDDDFFAVPFPPSREKMIEQKTRDIYEQIHTNRQKRITELEAKRAMLEIEGRTSIGLKTVTEQTINDDEIVQSELKELWKRTSAEISNLAYQTKIQERQIANLESTIKKLEKPRKDPKTTSDQGTEAAQKLQENTNKKYQTNYL